MQISLTRKRFHIIERCAGEFLRRIYLPESVDKEDIQTEFTDGVLRVLMSNVKNKKPIIFKATDLRQKESTV